MANVNGFDPAAWSIDGARHRGELLRVLGYVASNGSEGIVAPGDCKVHQVGAGTSQVAIDAGAVLVRNRSSNARNQTYAGNGRTESRMDVKPTGTTKRSDLVIVRMEDPQYSPWPKPPAGQEPDYQYVKPFIIENVDPSITRADQVQPPLNYSAYALARIDIPANTTNITDGMIKSTRRLANPHTWRDLDSQATPYPAILTSGSFVNWPTWNFQTEIPLWATRMRCKIDIQGIGTNNQPADGELRGRIVASGLDSWSGSLRYDLDPGSAGGGMRVGFTITVGDEVPASARGQLATVSVFGLKYAGSPGSIGTNESSHMAFDVQYYETVV